MPWWLIQDRSTKFYSDWGGEELRMWRAIHGFGILAFLVILGAEAWCSRRFGIEDHVGALICAFTDGRGYAVN